MRSLFCILLHSRQWHHFRSSGCFRIRFGTIYPAISSSNGYPGRVEKKERDRTGPLMIAGNSCVCLIDNWYLIKLNSICRLIFMPFHPFAGKQTVPLVVWWSSSCSSVCQQLQLSPLSLKRAAQFVFFARGRRKCKLSSCGDLTKKLDVNIGGRPGVDLASRRI